MHLGRVSFLALKWHKFLSHASLDLGVCGYLTIYCLYTYIRIYTIYIFFLFLVFFCIFSVVAFCLNLKSTAATTTLMFMSRTDNNDDDSNDLGANLL